MERVEREKLLIMDKVGKGRSGEKNNEKPEESGIIEEGKSTKGE